MKRGCAKAAGNDYAGAIGDFNEALRLGLDNPGACISPADPQGQVPGGDGVIAGFHANVQGERFITEVYYRRGNVKRRSSDYDGAIADYDEVIRRDSSNARAYIRRGIAKKLAGRRLRAGFDFRRARRLGCPR